MQSPLTDSNRRPPPYHGGALPTELRGQSRQFTCFSPRLGRATIEQAKGILMARHTTDAEHAFELLRAQSQRSGRKLVDVARAVVDSHLLLLPAEPTSPR